MASEMSDRVDGGVLNVKTLKMVGFKVLLSWHYLILFSPLFIGPVQQSLFPFFFQRQLTLYLTLAASFGILVGVGRYFLKKNKTAPSPVLLVSAGVLATAATLLSVLALDAGIPAKLATVVLLGFSEAFLMFLWLHYYTQAAAGHLFRSFAVDMVFGGIIGFLTCSLQHPLGLAVAVFLPLVATVSLVVNWGAVQPVAEAERAEATLPPRKVILRHSLKTLLPTTVYAFVFGLIQGGFLVSNVALLMAGNSVVLVGVVIAGAIVFFIREQPGTNGDIDIMHRCSLLLFVLGVGTVGLSFVGGGNLVLLASEIAILAGFNLFDFGGMILGIGLARRLKPGSLMLVDGGRVFTYAALALGLLAGNQAMLVFGGDQPEFVLLTICGAAITLLTATVLTPFRDQEPLELQVQRELDQGESDGAVPQGAAQAVSAGADPTPSPACAECPGAQSAAKPASTSGGGGLSAAFCLRGCRFPGTAGC